MKVIGVTQYTYIVEMDAAELERLTGSETYQGTDQRKIGSELKIRSAWDTIRALQCGAADLPKLANRLRALADILEPIGIEIPVSG